MIKNKKIITFILLIVLAGLAMFLFLQTSIFIPPLKITNVSPENNSINTSLLPEIKITFNRKASSKEINFSSLPSFPYQVTVNESSYSLIYLPEQLLEKKTKYQIKLKINSKDEYFWSFTTGESEAGAVPGWEEGFRKEVEKYEEKHPLEEVTIINQTIKQIPYLTSEFWIEYSERNETFTVHLCQQPYEQTKEKVENWFNNQGFGKLKKLKPKVDWLYGCEPPKIIPKITP